MGFPTTQQGLLERAYLSKTWRSPLRRILSYPRSGVVLESVCLRRAHDGAVELLLSSPIAGEQATEDLQVLRS